MTDLMELASRVEAGEEPDRELDVRISLALSGTPYSDSDVIDMLAIRDEPTGYGVYRPADEYVPAYTASLDAAMTLVPEGWDWTLYSDGSCEIGRKPDRGCLMNADYIAEAATPALALTAAALRAHQGTAHVEQ